MVASFVDQTRFGLEKISVVALVQRRGNSVLGQRFLRSNPVPGPVLIESSSHEFCNEVPAHTDSMRPLPKFRGPRIKGKIYLTF